ncbi:MAG: valine--tRNA ligase [Thermogemmata sp.]|jgi:valyl-tRNA synthetase|uniref:Valine--tRNA ligase n=1 Tax=Thermogemmata fonticola TaxID=2755323 RepID=A0A7V9ACQ8_9BACT|nr:valine--tRNA ligase [Thermogemmata fonticola]MBA2227304.1 valine--tRNA ligase [Thermogemmata fonticola]
MAMELPKAYDPKLAQQQWLRFWEERGYFHSDPDPQRPAFTIVIPPPNVTGALHMGHALNNTLQDVLIRWRRMQGYNALWIPGTDHAGIATQSVVERLIYQQEKKTRHDLGREALVQRIWAWKDKYEARILAQLQQMGASCDYRRTRFTLDPVCARAVRETFFRMFRDGYIYRGKRLVNWDTQLQTSVADDETYTEETPGFFWTFKYPVEGMPDTYIRFSTTRPETMLGDTAVCVHPADPRYQHLIGKTAIIPLNGRRIPIIADAILADPKLGTGCVKVTPAHDPNDYACWQRHPEIGMINILNPDGTLNENGGEFAGMDRYAAREAVIRKMQELGFYEGCEERLIPLKYSDRSKTPIEPYLSDQWFIRMGDRDDGKPGLAQLAIDAVTSGKVRFFPERYKEGYLSWLAEKRDWCISRQLWWGHRIPVWYVRGPEDAIRAAEGPDLVAHYDAEREEWLVCSRQDIDTSMFGPGVSIRQDEDVLDTWFSSALWPHSTLGWPGPALPEDRPDRVAPDWQQLRPYYYPTSVLVTSRDIITLWVARMVLASLYNVGEVPFHHVYIHPKVLDGFGETMSKTKGNGVDPLDVIDIYGVDALRYGMVHLATETQDSRMPVVNICPHCQAQIPVRQEHMYMRTRKITCPQCKKPFRPGGPWPSDDPELPTAKQGSDRFEVGRNFANKLWNATRFLLLNLEGYSPALLTWSDLPTEDRWILSRLSRTAQDVTAALEAYRFSEVSRLLYDFIWSEFCDWYIELSKGRLKEEASRPLVQRVLVGVLDAILRLVQPIMPFVAESLWQALGQVAPHRGLPAPSPAEESVVIARWPLLPPQWIDPQVEQRFALLQDLVRGIRELRGRYQMDERTKIDVFVKCSEQTAEDLQSVASFLAPLAGIGQLQAGAATQKPSLAGSIVHPQFEAYVPLAGLIDLAAEVRRLEKQLAEKRKACETVQSKLANDKFVQNAPPEIVQQQRELLHDLTRQIAALEENLRELQAAGK